MDHFSVPAGRIGDEAQYRLSWRLWVEPDGSPSQWTGGLDHAFRVTSLGDAIDETGMPHDVLVVDYDIDLTSLEAGFELGREFIDLDTRDIVQKQFTIGPQTGDDPWWVNRTDYGPLFEEFYFDNFFGLGGLAVAEYFENHNHSYEFQSRTFRLGQDLTESETGPFFLEAVTGELLPRRFAPFGLVITLNRYSYRSYVSHGGTLEGDPVFSIVRELDLHYLRHHLNGTTRAWDEKYRTTYWLSPHVPYPVRIERHLERMGPTRSLGDPAQNFTFVDDLVRYEPGVDPIPWGSCDAAEHYRRSNPDVERSRRPASHPLEGDGPVRLAYTLSEALAAIESDAGLRGFHDWRTVHPSSVVAGSRYRPGMPNAPAVSGAPIGVQPLPYDRQEGNTWELVFVDPVAPGDPSQAFLVHSGRERATGRVINAEPGAAPMRPSSQFSGSELPEDPITWGSIDAWWRRLGPTVHTSGEPNRVQLGLMGSSLVTPAPQLVRNSVGQPKAMLGIVWWGHCADKEGPDNYVEPPFAFVWWDPRCSLLSINVTTGNLWLSVGYEFKYDSTPRLVRTVDSLSGGGAVVEAAAASGERDSAPILLGGVAATSLLALLLVAYFFPLLKYVGAQVVGGLPGYAKLRQEDLLGHETRDQLVQLVRAEPGISPPELHRRIGGGWTTIVYHLRVLEKNKVLSSLVDGRHKRFFPVDGVGWTRRGAVAVLRNERTRQLYEILQDEPGLIQAELSRRLGVRPTAIRWHVERLERAGLVDSGQEGRRTRYWPAATLPPSPHARTDGIEVA